MSTCANCDCRLQGAESYCPSCGSIIKGHDITIETSLPISLDHKEAIRIDLRNSSYVKVKLSELDLYPFYFFDFELGGKRKDPSGKFHTLEDKGIFVVDALDGSLLSTKAKYSKNLFRLLFFRKRLEEEKQKILERNQTIDDLNNIEPKFDYRIIHTEDYSVNVLNDRVTLTSAENNVIRYVIKQNRQDVTYKVKKSKGKSAKRIFNISPRKSEITFTTKRLTYVPIWKISFKSGDCVYSRRVLATSGTFIHDDIMNCSKHSTNLAKSKKTLAVCEICGLALCADHIFRVDKSFYCESHKPDQSNPENSVII